MYTSFFGLNEKPFAITPDPRYLFLSERHSEALAHLLYGINEAGGFIQLTGEVGTGKTTIVRTLLSRLPQHADVAVILNPRVTATEFLLTICEELGIAIPAADRDSVKQLVDALNRRLLTAHAEGRRVVVIVDEAQNLSPEVLEQVRLLTNLETSTQKLLQIILIGQPELRDLLDRTELRQLAQRITGRYHLNPLTGNETRAYVRHRLRVAGLAGEIFTPGALSEVHRLSSGIPRVVNVCCDRALLGAYTLEERKITAALVRRAAGEVYGRRFAPPWISWVAGGVGIIAVGASVFGGWHYWGHSLPNASLAANLWSHSEPAADLGAESAGMGSTSGNTEPGAMSAPTPAPATTPAPAVVPTAAPAATPGPPPSSSAARKAAALASAAKASAAALSANSPAATAPAASAPAAATGRLGTLLAANQSSLGDPEAYRRLMALWGTTLLENTDPCGQASKAGLACFDQRGTWTDVRLLNRPAILTLTDEHGKRYRVVLTAMSDQSATLIFGDHNEQVPLDEVSQAWSGDFTVVWRPKTRRPRQLSVGMSGEEVRWLRRSLNTLQGAAPDAVGADLDATDAARGDLFDKKLAAAVENFQREHHVNADGVAGIQLQIMVDTALADPDSPLLQAAGARGG